MQEDDKSQSSCRKIISRTCPEERLLLLIVQQKDYCYYSSSRKMISSSRPPGRWLVPTAYIGSIHTSLAYIDRYSGRQASATSSGTSWRWCRRRRPHIPVGCPNVTGRKLRPCLVMLCFLCARWCRSRIYVHPLVVLRQEIMSVMPTFMVSIPPGSGHRRVMSIRLISVGPCWMDEHK